MNELHERESRQLSRARVRKIISYQIHDPFFGYLSFCSWRVEIAPLEICPRTLAEMIGEKVADAGWLRLPDTDRTANFPLWDGERRPTSPTRPQRDPKTR